MIYHIFNSEFSYLKHARNCFDRSDIPSVFLIISSVEPKHIPEGSRFIKHDSSDYVSFVNILSSNDLVLFHSLLTTNIHVAWDIISLNGKRPVLSWVLYGSEITFLHLTPDAFHDPKTRILYYRQKPLRLVLPLQRLLNLASRHSYRTLLRKMDFIAHFMDEEVEFLRSVSGTGSGQIYHAYTMLEDFIGSEFLDRQVVPDGHLLIGNSSSYTSNHIQIIDQLRKGGPADRKIIVPLNYGNTAYARYISRYGKQQLGERFTPILEFMPLPEYTRLLLSCSAVIMNHYRQQAMGNILTQLYTGSRVYLNDFTSSFRFLKRLGLHVFSLQHDMDYRNPECFKALGEREREENRVLLLREFGIEAVKAKLRESFLPYAQE